MSYFSPDPGSTAALREFSGAARFSERRVSCLLQIGAPATPFFFLATAAPDADSLASGDLHGRSAASPRLSPLSRTRGGVGGNFPKALALWVAAADGLPASTVPSQHTDEEGLAGDYPRRTLI